MATGAFLGTNYTLQTTPTVGTFVDGKLEEGHVMCSIDTCIVSGSDYDNGSTMHIAKLPKGAVVLFSIVTPIASTGIATAMNNAVTADMGITGYTSLFGSITALNVTAPQYIRPIPDATLYTAAVGMTPLKSAADVFLTTTSGGVLLEADDGVEVRIFYSVR